MSIFDKLPLGNRNEPKAEYFFALNITHHTLIAAVWGIVQKKLQVINSVEVDFTESDDLIDAANRALDQVLADFSPEPKQILFGVPDSWLQDENLKDEYLKLLQHLVKELDVSPMAYVSTNYAIAHLLQKQSGAPINAILVNAADPLSVAIVKGGKIMGSKIQKHIDDLPQDIEKALLGIHDVEVLPSKIIIYNSNLSKEQLAKLKDELHAYAWMSSLPFLHLPKIETLDESIEIRAICFAGGSEIEPQLSFHDHALVTEHLSAEDAMPDPSELDANLAAAPQEDGLAELGFVEGDIAGATEEVISPEAPEAEDPGYPEPGHLTKHEQALLAEDERFVAAPTGNGLMEKILSFPTALMGGFGKGREVATHHPSHRSFLSQATKYLIGLAVLMVGLTAAYVFLPTATVTLFVDPLIREKEAEIIADPAITAIDEANKKIPGKIVDASITGTDTIATTGKKKIGDPAKGSAMLYNKTDQPKVFPKGTILVGSGNLTYSLDTEVSLASKSAYTGGISFGKSSVAVTAAEIGPESNLTVGKALTIKDQLADNFSADVDKDITGGTSKEVGVVTADDQKKLQVRLAERLRQQAKDEIQKKLTGDMKILSEALTETIGKSTFNKAVNDQSSDLGLSLTVSYKGTAYGNEDLNKILSQLVQTETEDGYTINLDNTEMQTSVVKQEKDGRLVFQAKFRAKLQPVIDTEKIKSEIVGKTSDEVQSISRQNQNVISSKITTSYKLPPFLQRMPLRKENITIEVVTN